MDVWIADDKECWVRGVVIESAGNTLKVRKNSNKSEKVITVDPNIERELLPANLPENTNMADIIKTEYLHEATLLETLSVRHANATSSSSSGITCEEIYTYAGPVLLSCNPFKRLDIYGPDVMHRYSASMDQVSFILTTTAPLNRYPHNSPPFVISLQWTITMWARCTSILTTRPRVPRPMCFASLETLTPMSSGAS